MARIKYAIGETPLINQHGGYTFQPNKQGQSMFPGQKNGRWRYPAQELRQQNLMKSVNIWRNQSSGTVSNWESFVTAYPQACKNPDSGYLTAYQNFIKRNQYQFLNFGLDADIITSPIVEELTAIDYTFTMFLEDERLYLSCEFSDVSENIIVSVFSSRVLSPGQLYNGSKTRYMGYLQNKIDPIFKYSRLYNAFNISDARGFCPAGWEFPSYIDFWELGNFIQTCFDRLTNTVGGYLKSTCLDFWQTPNSGASNSVGFSARGSGLRIPVNGVFVGLDQQCNFWNKEVYPANPITQHRASVVFYNNEYFSTSTYSCSGFQNVGQINQAGYSIRLINRSPSGGEGSIGTVTGNDGNVYPTIVINGIEWMSVSSCETKFRNGDNIPNITDNSTWAAATSAAYCDYNNAPSNSVIGLINPTVDITENWINRFGILPQVGQKVIFKFFPMALNSGQFFPEQQIYLTVE